MKIKNLDKVAGGDDFVEQRTISFKVNPDGSLPESAQAFLIRYMHGDTLTVDPSNGNINYPTK